MTAVSFKISSALKNIIGKELITDDFIAVFELVKNSFDANARRVEIIFEEIKTGNPKIIVKDDGEGMNEDDLENKWLFVAYSAKKVEQDYRNKIKTDRIFAGAKGIGRFSCDRLGEHLKLTTRKKGDTTPFNVLDVDWSRFEIDPGSEFQTIKAQLSKSDTTSFAGFDHGTILEISDVRSKDWDRKKLLRLRRSLERLINPNQGNDAASFSVVLVVPEEEKDDEIGKESHPDEPWEIVNGPIRNFLFETLELKTTQIQIQISEGGETILTQLLDRGTLIYELLEKNPFEALKNISINLFFLNRSAKYTFSRKMGLPNVQYGSVFLYKNGFRIHPYGDLGNDYLGIDRRKQQGQSRFLGSRDLSGRIEINGNNPDFQETSSRDGGLIRNRAFESLTTFFYDYALRRLENYVIELAKFGQGLEDLPELHNPDSKDLRNFVFNLIVKLTKSKNVINFRYEPDVLNILENRSSESVTALLRNLQRISTQQNNTELSLEISRAEKQVQILARAKREAEEEALRESTRASKAEQAARESSERAQRAEESARQAQKASRENKDRAQTLNTQNLFLRSVLSKDLEHVIELHHTIGQDARTIEQFASILLGILKNHEKDKPIDIKKLQTTLERISYSARKINTVSRFATRANFRADAENIKADLISYIREYLLNIYGESLLDPYQNKIAVNFRPPFITEEFITNFTPINISIIFDNLISNSRKHKSKSITVTVKEVSQEKLVISFCDDGKGIPHKNMPYIFDIGFTTTEGSGLGLYHSRNIMLDMGGNLEVNTESAEGAEFLLTFNKE